MFKMLKDNCDAKTKWEEFKKANFQNSNEWNSIWNLIIELKELGVSAGHPTTTIEGDPISEKFITDWTLSKVDNRQKKYVGKLVSILCSFRSQDNLFVNDEIP